MDYKKRHKNFCDIRKQDNYDVFNQITVDFKKINNPVLSNIISDKKRQVLSILDILDMNYFKNKYRELPKKCTIRDENHSFKKVHKSEIKIKQENDNFPLINFNLIHNKKILDSNEKLLESNNNQACNSKSNTQFETFENSNSVISNIRNIQSRNFYSTNNRNIIHSSYSNRVQLDNRIDDKELTTTVMKKACSVNDKNNIKSIENFNSFFAKSILMKSFTINKNIKLSKNIEDKIVNKMLNNCFLNGKTIDSDFRVSMDKQGKKIDLISNSLKKDPDDLRNIIPIDKKSLERRKNECIYPEGKNNKLNVGHEDNESSNLEKLSFISPNLANQVKGQLIEKLRGKSEIIPSNLWKRKEETNIKKKCLHENIDKLLKDFDLKKNKLIKKIDAKDKIKNL